MKGSVFLVNASHPLPDGYVPKELAPALPGSSVMLEAECAQALHALIAASGGLGSIVPVSGYRPHAEQAALWRETLATHGEDFTRQYVALPGCSEHETGLAIDLALDTGEEIDFIRPYFPYDGVCAAMRALAAEYGFIERYTSGKELVTGISAEPWHFRYVGTAHAKYIAAHGLALEEYIAKLALYPGLQVGEAYFVPHGQITPEIDGVIEDSNAGGLILTSRRVPNEQREKL